MIRRNFCMFPSCFFHVFLPQILKRYKEEGFISPPFFFFFNKNLLTACVPRKPLPQFPTSLMAPELGETQGTAPRAKSSDRGKERGPEDRDGVGQVRRSASHRLVGTHLDEWL